MVLITLTGAMWACGSDGEVDERTIESTLGPRLSLEEYYQQVNAAFNRMKTASAASAESSEPTDASELLPFIQNSLGDLSLAMDVFTTEVNSLNPPELVADAHAEFARALKKDSESISELANDVQKADNITEASEAVASRGATLLESREPCRDLQRMAVQQNVNVALPCDE